MAGTLTMTTSPVSARVTKYAFAWTSDASGNVSATSFNIGPGTILAVDFVPSGGGTAPTAAYDVTFLDSRGVNLFDDGAGTSVGADLSATVATRRCPLMGTAAVGFFRAWLPGDACTLTVANGGNAKQGTVNVYVTSQPL
jgi:hypothetical protein